MIYDYEAIQPASDAEFERHRVPPERLDAEYTKADDNDLLRIERLLDIREGSLGATGPYYLKADDCRNCGSAFKVSDFVLTSLLDADHPKDFVAQVLQGDKKIIQRPRAIRCFDCGTVSDSTAQYWMNYYVCTNA